MDIPFVDLAAQYRAHKDAIDAAVLGVLAHGRYVLGPEVAALEAALAAHCGARHAIALSSGTDALQAALMAWEVGPGDAVLVPAFTFCATAEVVCLVGATPVFVDVDPDSGNIEPAALADGLARIRSDGALRPRAVIAVDLYGLPARYETLAPMCDAHGLHLLADAAQSYGGARAGIAVGRLAPISATSFYPSKPLGCYGDGGAVFTDDDELAARLRSIRVHGSGAGQYDNVRIGLNARLDSIQAAVLAVKLPHLADEIAARERLAARYDGGLADVVTLPARDPDTRSAWAQYTIQVDGRAEVQARLAERGIPTMVYYPRPVHLQPGYACFGGGAGSLPVAEALSARVLSLPMHAYMSDAQADAVIDGVRQVVRAP